MSNKKPAQASISDQQYRECVPVIRSVCNKWRGIPGREREDLEQDCLLQLVEQFHKFDSDRYVWQVWVSVVAVATCRRAWVESKRDHIQFTDAIGEVASSHETADGDVDEHAVNIAREQLAGLNPDQAKLLSRLYGLDGDKPAETAVRAAQQLRMSRWRAAAVMDRPPEPAEVAPVQPSLFDEVSHAAELV
jgi:DNA-directed RNA polymerase specialized sigma24 family protein